MIRSSSALLAAGAALFATAAWAPSASATTYSLTAIGALTEAYETGDFASLGIKIGDPYVYTLSFSNCSTATFGQLAVAGDCGVNTITAKVGGHTFTHSFAAPDQPFPLQYAGLRVGTATPTDHTVQGSIAEYTAPLGAGDGWIMVLIDNSSDNFVPSDDLSQYLVHPINPATEEFFQFGFQIVGADGSQLALGENSYGPSPARLTILNGPAPEPATWAMLLLGVGAVGGALRRGRRQGPAAA